MKKLVVVLFTLYTSLLAGSNSGYVKVEEIRSWEHKNDIFMAVEHTCSGSDSKRYVLEKGATERYALLMTAFASDMIVNLYYECVNEYPNIMGVKMRKE
jgi:hypothetical protein